MASPRTASTPTSTPAASVSPEASRVIWLLLIAAFVAILNETTMSVAIPHLITDLGITAVQAQWLTTAFMLTMAVVIPVTGFLLRRWTTRTAFVTAMSLFTVGTAIALFAPGFEVLVAARVVQASGTAIMMPLLMTTIMTVVPPNARGRMMGRVSIVIAFAPAIGPSVSGLILDSLNWRWIFGFMLPIAAIALAIGARWIRNLGESEHARIDVLSVILSAFGFGGVVFGLSQIGGDPHSGAAESTGSSSTLMLVVPLVVGAIGLVLFVWRQLMLQRRDAALLDLRVFTSRNFSFAVGYLFLMSMAFFGSITLIPLYSQNVLELTAFESGLIVLPGSILMGVAGPIVGRIFDASGPRMLLVPGSILTVAVLWGFSTLSESTPVWILVVLQTVLMLGLALSFTPLFTSALGSIPPQRYSYGSAVVNTIQQVAGAASIALMITIMSSVSAAAAESGADELAAGGAGTRAAFLVAAIIATPLLVGAFLVRKPADAPAGPVGH